MIKTIICTTVMLLFVVASSAVAAPTIDSYLNPNWTDADKAGVPPAPSDVDDNSCWIATASNMLASDGYGGGDAQAMYWDMVDHFTTVPGGWVHNALDWYLTTYPDPLRNSSIVYYIVDEWAATWPDAQPWPTDPFDLAADALADGTPVGLQVYGPDPVEDCKHAVTFQGYEWDAMDILITDSDQDVGGTAFGPDLDLWSFNTGGSYGWWIDGICSTSVDVKYFAMLNTQLVDPQVIPAPGAILLGSIGVGLVNWLRRRRTL